MTIAKLIRAAGLGIFGLWAALPGLAQDTYPSKPIHFVVPYPAGGTSDLFARSVAQRLSVQMGQPVVVENRGGANGNIGSDIVAKSAPDGYTLLMGSAGPLTINQSIYKDVPFDTLRDFAAVGLLAEVPLMMVVHPSVPVKSVDELIALAKSQPGKLTFGSSGNGSTQHLAAELFRSVAKVDMRHIPYKGAAPAMTDLLGGRIDLMIDLSPTALPRMKSGKLRGLAVTTASRIPAAPQLPTLQEVGLAGFEVTAWFGIVAPAGTPAPILAKLNAEIGRALQSAEVRDRFATQGATPRTMSPGEFDAHLRSEIAKWSTVVRQSKAQVD